MAQVTVAYKALPTLAAFHRSDDPTRCVVGPFGSGKSVAAIIELAMNSRLSVNTRYVCVRKTYRMLQDTVIKTFFEWIPKTAGQWREADMTFTMDTPGRGKAEFLFRSAESPEDIEKFKGLEISGYWLDEAVEMPSEVKLVLQGRLRYPKEHTRFIGVLTTNPCDTEHWIYRDFVANPLPGHKYFKQPWDENKPNLRAGYYEEMAAAYRDRPELLRRYVYGEWGSVFHGKQVYPEFNFDFHVAKAPLAPVQGVQIVRGWDFGLSPACIFTQVHPNGQWLVLREIYSDDSSIDEFGDAVVSFANREFRGFEFVDVGDPAGRARAATDESSCYDILAAKQIYCKQAATNALMPRLEAVKRKLVRTFKGRPALVIDPRCKRLIDGFSGGYGFKPIGNSGQFTEKPEKNQYSHIHDALQYAALDQFGYTEPDPKMWAEPMQPANLGIF